MFGTPVHLQLVREVCSDNTASFSADMQCYDDAIGTAAWHGAGAC